MKIMYHLKLLFVFCCVSHLCETIGSGEEGIILSKLTGLRHVDSIVTVKETVALEGNSFGYRFDENNIVNLTDVEEKEFLEVLDESQNIASEQFNPWTPNAKSEFLLLNGLGVPLFRVVVERDTGFCAFYQVFKERKGLARGPVTLKIRLIYFEIVNLELSRILLKYVDRKVQEYEGDVP